MIIFYNKITGEIFGTVDGREHEPELIEAAFIQPEGVAIEDIGKLVVATKPVEELIHVPIKEQRVFGGKLVKTVIVGHRVEKKVLGSEYDIPFAEKLYRHEDPRDEFNLIHCEVKVDKNGDVLDVEERVKQ